MANFLDDIFGPDPVPSAPGKGVDLSALGQPGPMAPGAGMQGPLMSPGPPAPADVSSLPEIKTGAHSDLGWIPSISATFKRLWTSDPGELAKSLATVPGVTIKHNDKGDPYAVIAGKQYSLNTKGASFQDVAPLATSLAANIGIGLATGGVSIPVQAAIAGAGEGGIMEAGKAASRGELPGLGDLSKSTGIGAASGLVGGLIASKLGGVLSRAGRLLDPNGNLTRTAEAAMRSVGIDPDNISASVLAQADRLLRGRVASPDTLRRAVAEVDTAMTGVPLTRGEASGNLTQRGKEVAAQEGISGDTAAATMRAFHEGPRREAIDVAGENVAGRIAPQATLGQPEYGMGENVIGAVRQAEQTAKRNVNDAYDAWHQAARQTNLAIPTANSNTLFSNIQNTLLRHVPEMNMDIMPRSLSILRRLQSDMGNTQFMTPEALEGIRRMISRSYGPAKNEDKFGVLQIKNIFDDWMEHEVGAATQGSPVGGMLMQTLRDARATAADRFDRFLVGSSKDPAQKVIESMLDAHVQPEDIAAKLLGGKTQFTSSGAGIFARLQHALGPNDPVLDDVKRQVVMRIIGGSADMQALDAKGAQAMSSSISKAIGGSGQRYANIILGQEGTDSLLQLQRQLQRIIRPSQLANYSRTSYDLRRTMTNLVRNMIGGGVGGAVGAVGGAAVGPIGAGVGSTAGVIAGQKIASSLAERSGARLAQKALRPTRVSPATQATIDQIKGLLGDTAATGLPTATGVGGFSILDLPQEQQR